MSESRAKRIKLIIFDVDGVLTDGRIFLFPAPAGVQQTTIEAANARKNDGGFAMPSPTMIEAKGFHAHDGTAFSFCRLAGIKTAFITKRISETVALRARDLRVEYLKQGSANKILALREILDVEKIEESEVAYVGDDVIDLPVMRRVGLAIAVANARNEVKAIAHYITEHNGGEGAARDAVEYILRAKGILEQVQEDYMHDRSSALNKVDVSAGK